MSDISSVFPSMNTASVNPGNHRTRVHSVLPEGNSTSTSPNGTGAVQSFGSILAGVTSAGEAAKRSY